MKGSVHNLRGASGRRTAVGAGFATFAILALVGAVSFPMRGLQAVKDRHAMLTERVRRTYEARDKHERFAAVSGLARVRAAAAAVDATLPKEVSTVDLHGTVRLLAAAAGIELDNLSVGQFVPTELPVFEDAVARCELVLGGAGGLDSLGVVLEALGELGYPAILLDFQVLRADVAESRFELRATIGVFQSEPPPPVETFDPSAPQEGIP